jgi:RNA polymerase sigma-70 factor, ECF subfamily
MRVVTPSEREISPETIESCRRGDREAFRALYDAYKDRVYSIALYFFHGDATVASDVTQQVFLKLMTSIRQFRGESAFSTWLHRLVVNVCLDGTRRTRSQSAAADPAVLDSLARPPSHEDDFAREQTAKSVRAAVSMLPPKCRLAILLRYFEGLSYGEIAEALNCSIGTVASRLSRGHQILAERLAPLRSALKRE